VKPSDIRRLAAHFRVLPEIATQRFTKLFGKERILRRKADKLFGQACMFLDQETRKCTIYHARPLVCREFPITARCAYYDLIQFEREQQDDPDVIPLVKITFKNGKGK
jgi:Fe-S-cluster containining protein